MGPESSPIQRMCSGFRDVGECAYADLNVIDLESLGMEVPEFGHDLPAGAGRWTQGSRSHDYTVVNGQSAIENGCHTGRLNGRVLRA